MRAKLLLICLLSVVCAGCATNLGIGPVVHQVEFCEEPGACKAKLIQACPQGGTIHRISPALAVEYSCK